jgi:hypothetical protein
MTTLTVGNGEQYSTIAAAVTASHTGDTINVDAGTYTNDVLNISHSLTLQAVGGTVNLVGTAQPANGKGLIDEGGAGVRVAITGFDISGATVKDMNGAGIRYEGGTLTLSRVNVHDNQNGILANADANGSITIANSTFAHNGIGDGQTHNIYVGAVGSLTVKDSTITAAQVGHDIKSRAASTTITGNTITDGAAGTASYEIDLTNGGVGDIENNFIEKGANAQNPTAITFGEEGSVYANSGLTVKNNTIVTNYTAHNSTAVVNRTGATANISGNQLYGWTAVASGPASVSSNATLASEPTSSSIAPSAVATPAPATAVAPDASSSAAITPDTVAAGSVAPSFMADASASAPQNPADSPAPPAASDMASQVLASYTETATPSAAAGWTDGSAQAGAADASTPLGIQHPHHHGASPMTDASGQAAGTTGHVRMHHS